MTKLPWNKCMKKVEKEGNSKKTSQKICGAIRQKSLKKQWKKKTVKTKSTKKRATKKVK